MKNKLVNAADLFCGAGGSSSGLVDACQELGLQLNLLAINHWDIAIQTHSANHVNANHICDNLENVDPHQVVPSGRLRLLVASPECVHFSNARGGRPVSKQSRATIKYVLRWVSALDIQDVLIENVREFMDWGPLYRQGPLKDRPIHARKGEYFRRLIFKLESSGYRVEWRILCAADYGDPTSRKRLFIRARKGKGKIVWPAPTHSQNAEETLFGQLPRWRAAREIIDWNMKGESIFRRKKPLSPNTMERIVAGLKKFGGKAFVIGQQSKAAPRDVDQPIPTVAGAGAISFVEPFLVEYHGGQDSERRVKSVDQPLPAQDTSNRFGLVEPFILSVRGGDDGYARARSIDEPLPSITTQDPTALVEPFIIPVNHGKDTRSHSVDEPMRAITSVGAWALIEPFIMKYTSTGGARPVDEPLSTITGRDKFGIVIPELNGAVLDIRFRMLQPHELALAMSFPQDYVFVGNREQRVKQIGNAVPRMLAKALCKAALEN